MVESILRSIPGSRKNPMFESLILSDVPGRQCGVLRRPSRTRPALWVVEEEGVRAVVKDYSPNGFLFRNIVGRFLVWREMKAYRRLKNLRGIPAYFRNLGGLALVIEEVRGRTVEGLEDYRRLPEEFFRDLEALVEEVHRRGLVHCDLKRAPNTLVDSEGRPHIVDWSASLFRREFRFFPLNHIYRRFIMDDLNAVTKLQLRHCPDSVGPERMRRYRHRSRAESLVRALRDRGRDLLQKIA